MAVSSISNVRPCFTLVIQCASERDERRQHRKSTLEKSPDRTGSDMRLPSALGLYRILVPAASFRGSVARKVMWTMLMLFGVGFMIFQIQDRIFYYLSWPTKVDYKIIEGHDLRFPSVTVCSVSGWSREAAVEIFRDPRIPDLVMRTYPIFPNLYFESSMYFQDLKLPPWIASWEDLYLSASANSLHGLLECRYNNEICDLTEAIESQMTETGICFTFNPRKSDYRASHPGAVYGLRLTLYTNQSDYLTTSSAGAGFTVLLHDPREIPSVRDLGFLVSPGMMTSAAFSFRNVTQLPPPYGDCRSTENYTFANCMYQCYLNFTLIRCKCRPIQLPGNGPACNPDEYMCINDYIKSGISAGIYRQCGCPLQCNQQSYPHSISSSRFSQHSLSHLSHLLSLKGRNITASRVEREVAILDVYFNTLTYTNVEAKPAYNLLNLLCDMGGALGLILGATVLTFFEIFQLIFDIFGMLFYQSINRFN